MITGRSYADVVKDFHNDFDKKGIFTKQTIEYLADAGFSVIKKEVVFFNEKDDGRKELLKPFAPVHIVSIKQYFDLNKTHAVVMDAKGKLICPHGMSDAELRKVYRVEEVIGLYK